MKETKRVSCPVKYGDCVITEEAQKLLNEGWKIAKTQYKEQDFEVTFFLEREVADNG